MKYRAFIIEPCLNGFIVTIGCQRAVFQTLEEFAENLMLYAKDPDGVEKIWIDRSLVQRDLPPTLEQNVLGQGEQPAGSLRAARH